MMRLQKAISVLNGRREYLLDKTKQLKDAARSYYLSEIAAIEAAVRSMEVLRSYGFVVLSADGPYLRKQRKEK